MSGDADSAIYITGLPTGCDDDKLKEIFSKYGTVVSNKVLPPQPMRTGTAGIVSMESAEKAKWVVDNVDGTVPDGLTGPIEIKHKNKGWKSWGDDQNDGTVYISGLPEGFDDDKVKEFFEKYGPVKSAKALRPRPDKTDVAAIVSMVSVEQAKTLIENVSGTVPAGLTEPITIKAKLPSQNWDQGWGGKGGFGGGNMNPFAMMQMLYMGQQKGMGGKGWGGGGGMMGGGYGGGKGGFGGGMGGFGGKGWGGGKGSGLSNFPSDKKVWVGGLPEDVTFRELLEHFGGQGAAKFATVMKGKGAGTGGVAFGSAEEAVAAVARLNGSSLKGATIVVDVWTKKEADA